MVYKKFTICSSSIRKQLCIKFSCIAIAAACIGIIIITCKYTCHLQSCRLCGATMAQLHGSKLAIYLSQPVSGLCKISGYPMSDEITQQINTYTAITTSHCFVYFNQIIMLYFCLKWPVVDFSASRTSPSWLCNPLF